eukprot:m.377011 g.377011  ORF g.377011 m.377011 type:complete len:77 (+) comp16705_c1_seq1:336-566(+)
MAEGVGWWRSVTRGVCAHHPVQFQIRSRRQSTSPRSNTQAQVELARMDEAGEQVSPDDSILFLETTCFFDVVLGWC